MLISYKRSQTSIILRVKILNSSVTTGAGLTGLTSASSGLIISTIADNEATATAYTVAGSTIESITTLGTYAAPTATKCRFKEVDSTNHKGVYELQIADARFAVSNAKSLLVSILGATNAVETDVVIPLVDLDPYVASTPQTGDSYAIVSSGTHGNAAIKGYVDDIGTAGAGLTAIPWNAAWDAEVQSECDDALKALYLQYLLHTTYDPASKPGTADALLNEIIENDGGVSRFTANALEQGPSGGGSAPSAADVADAVWDEVASGHVTAGSAGYQLKTLLDAVKAKTDLLTTFPSNFSTLVIDGSGRVDISKIEGTDATDQLKATLLTSQLTESYAADGVAPTLAQAVFWIMQGVHEFEMSGTVGTVKKIDGSTTAGTFAVDSASSPTSRWRTG